MFELWVQITITAAFLQNVRSALQNAGSVVGLMLTTETVVTELKDKEHEVEGALT